MDRLLDGDFSESFNLTIDRRRRRARPGHSLSVHGGVHVWGPAEDHTTPSRSRAADGTERELAVSEPLCHPWGTVNIPGGVARLGVCWRCWCQVQFLRGVPHARVRAYRLVGSKKKVLWWCLDDLDLRLGGDFGVLYDDWGVLT